MRPIPGKYFTTLRGYLVHGLGHFIIPGDMDLKGFRGPLLQGKKINFFTAQLGVKQICRKKVIPLKKNSRIDN